MIVPSAAHPCPYWPPELQDTRACVGCPIAPLSCLLQRPVGRPLSEGGLLARQIIGDPVNVVAHQTGISERQVWRIRRIAAALT